MADQRNRKSFARVRDRKRRYPRVRVHDPIRPGPTQALGLFVNGSFQRPVMDYTLSGINITTTIALTADDTIDALMIG